MSEEKKYQKPRITKVKLKVSEALMLTCDSAGQKSASVKKGAEICSTASSCREPFS